jgi:hypothetical protein
MEMKEAWHGPPEYPYISLSAESSNQAVDSWQQWRQSQCALAERVMQVDIVLPLTEQTIF